MISIDTTPYFFFMALIMRVGFTEHPVCLFNIGLLLFSGILGASHVMVTCYHNIGRATITSLFLRFAIYFAVLRFRKYNCPYF